MDTYFASDPTATPTPAQMVWGPLAPYQAMAPVRRSVGANIAIGAAVTVVVFKVALLVFALWWLGVFTS